MVKACEDAGADEVFSTDDPEEGEAFAAARRMAIPAVERTGSLLLEDVGVPLPALPALVGGVAEIAERNAVTVAVIAHAGDGNTHPLIVYDPTDADQTARAHLAFGQIMARTEAISAAWSSRSWTRWRPSAANWAAPRAPASPRPAACGIWAPGSRAG